MVAIRWYLRYSLSYRDVEELLTECGIQVDHLTVFRWVQRFTPVLIDAARPCRHMPDDRWFVDETVRREARCDRAVGFQKSATCAEQRFHAARSYSLIRPPRTGRRVMCSWLKSAMG
jgi:hypothetical protein